MRYTRIPPKNKRMGKMPESECFVGIDTSNYTTSASVVSYDGKVLLNYKMPLPVKEGERGLRQSDAVYAHIKNQPSCMAAVSDFLKSNALRPVAVGYSASPVNSDSSFMPVFSCGRAFALSFAATLSLPVYAFSHQEGHIAAAVYSATEKLDLLKAPLYAFHVSGGTTDLIYCTPKKNRIGTERVGGSNDLHAGQLIDRIGVYSGLEFPCGPALEQEAEKYAGKPFSPKLSVIGLNANLSGCENIAKKLFDSDGRIAAARYTLEFIADTLDLITENLRNYTYDPIVYSGGVMSNRYIQSVLKKRKDTFFATPAFSSDNASGIALLARSRHMEE